MVEVSYLAAFFGGVLSLLSPCSALLLPAFFAYAFQSRKALIGKTAIFYAGLCVTLVPLGMGISAVSRLFYGQRSTLIVVAGIVIILLGVMQLLGRGFELGPLSRLQGKVRGDSTWSTFALGAVYGFAGFCSGPILGAVLTVAASSGQTLQGARLLAIYALGMAAPLFLMALLWDRFKLGKRRWLRGRELSFGPLRMHTTNLVSGLMFIVLGAVFIAYEGTSALSGLYEENGAVDMAFAAERWAGSLARSIPDALVFAVLLIVALALALVAYRRRHKPRGDAGDVADSDEEISSRSSSDHTRSPL
ncbi:MAG: putative cytochrome c biogenesis protein [uncultured Rubrobacteraceae bacterium]|uniref:Putative cytochrome c biogenesis protein n=1 Tax=uncultured Rubrobacteraceae bacterium TaxID=349277 RepID=A0A6J4R045_9ACTN|nr:MAG: putative cytochrome c biogenesis protein [uncultured Rubrobacteraceae bacterium]